MNNDLPEARRLEITLFGPLATSVLTLLHERYDEVQSFGRPGAGTVLAIGNIDQAGERAILTLLWDTGHQVRSVGRGES